MRAPGRLRRLQAHLVPAARPAGAPDPASTPPDALRQAREVALATTQGDHAVPSLAVAVSVRGKLVWEEAFGWAELGVRRATPDTLYSLASISKPFTTTGD